MAEQRNARSEKEDIIHGAPGGSAGLTAIFPVGYKYRLYYGYPGRRIVGYDNETGKGDHRHLDEHESRYAFVSVEALIDDFLADVERRRRA